jgi:mRNA-degrading endonuclease RelE of RelBE toxin-antitoxin system
VVTSGHVELSTKARRDLRRLARGPDRKPILDALTVSLVAIPPPDNLDVKLLEGHAPWLRLRLRLRVGVYRILYRPLTTDELAAVSQKRGHRIDAGYLAARIIHRRDLDRAVASLD